MSQLPHNCESQQPDANSTHQADSSAPQNVVQGNQNRAVQGQDNKAVQGDGNTVIQGNNNTLIINNIINNNYESLGNAFVKPVESTKNTLQKNRKEEYTNLLPKISARAKSISIYSKTLDFIKLKNLLEVQQFREADCETYHLILRAVNREKEGWIIDKDLLKLDFSIIYDIDRLWIEYSREKFGFIVQHVIWNTLNNQSNKFDLHILAESVGWRRNDQWLDYNKFTFSLEEAKEGHLPSFGYNMHPLHDWLPSYKNFFSYVTNYL